MLDRAKSAQGENRGNRSISDHPRAHKREWLFVSLGAGVQSSAMLLMYYHGKLEPMPDAAIFADTQAEPSYVYENLQRLKEIVKDRMPVLTVMGGNLGKVELNPLTKIVKTGTNKGKKFSQCPFFFPHGNGEVGMGKRQCTPNFKLRALSATKKQFMGYRPRQRVKEKVYSAIGISLDEAVTRMKASREKWITNIWPLVDLGYTRTDCMRYIESLGMPIPLRSACYFCPFRSNAEWREMRERSPETFARAVEFDRKLREVPTYFKEQYVHRSCKPLDEAIESTDNQPSLFEALECEGMCGV